MYFGDAILASTNTCAYSYWPTNFYMQSICVDKFIPKLGVFKSRVQCPLEEVNELMKVDQVLEFMAFVGPGISKIAQADV
ncbi:hypothetical protein DCAR_0208810 [Daucus carota subsp. sativus]|uniref:Uncharacterized protein n=1 Tax=Daucus carota subsp. sativus TaxID=79200 RepID=A0A162AHG8_DAUCS|nr:hypothetical protein DCAR_0208810 [Daucus carota subsp. sativus]